MKLTFVSNYINHHQIPVSNELYAKLKDDYTFIQTEPMEEERIKMGWGGDFDSLPYLKKYYENEELCKKLIAESDVVIFGGCDDESYISDRLEEGKPIVRYSERLYKEGQWKWISPRGLKKKYHDHTRHSDSKVYLLCAGAYVADDFNIIRAYKGKRFKWGYFPEFIEYTDDERKQRRDDRRSHESLQILWVGRLIDWKHPESVIRLAQVLKSKNIAFEITVIGDGDMREDIESRIDKSDLKDSIKMVGSKSPEEVREYMNQSDIFLFTSDYKEGWGAVLNEAMNAGCAIVASHAAGAVPTLIKHRQNGLIFPSKDFDKMSSLVEELSKDQKWRLSLGENAYETIENEWNHKEAANRLYNLCNQILNGRVEPYRTGPVSEARVIHERKMYKHLIGVDKYSE